MKLCKRCFGEFDEDEGLEYSPARELGDIFSQMLVIMVLKNSVLSAEKNLV